MTNKSGAIGTRTETATQAQVAEMVADPEAYFAKVRREAREEAELYVARRTMALRTGKRRRRLRGSFYLRMPFTDGREVAITASTPLTGAEFDYLIAALTDLRPALTGKPKDGDE